METLRATSVVSSDSSWFIQQGGNSTAWTKEENKKFESALAIFDEKTPNRWFRVAAMIPGKSVYDVINQYRVLEADVCDIEAGLFPIPAYLSSSFTYELADLRSFDVCRKRARTNCDQERKKGVPWTEDEHRRFLLGLQKHGKGDWRNISRNFVISKTPTQVASHAQKYYLRQLSGAKDKRRPSIHDITTVHVATASALNNNNSNNNNNNNNNEKPSFHENPVEQMSTSTTKIPVDRSGHINDKTFMDFDSSYNDLFISHPCNVAPQIWHSAKTGATTTPYIQI